MTKSSEFYFFLNLLIVFGSIRFQINPFWFNFVTKIKIGKICNKTIVYCKKTNSWKQKRPFLGLIIKKIDYRPAQTLPKNTEIEIMKIWCRIHVIFYFLIYFPLLSSIFLTLFVKLFTLFVIWDRSTSRQAFSMLATNSALELNKHWFILATTAFQ